MMDEDARSFRVALVADEYVNPGRGGGLDALAVLGPAGWGVMQLPPSTYSDEIARPLLEQVAEQVEEFVRRDYDVILVGRRAGLEEALAAMGVGAPDDVVPATGDELTAFVSARPAPRAAAARA